MRFLFVHGSWHGAWVWRKVLPYVELEGHEAIAIDLPGRGRAPATPALVGLGAMTQAILRALPSTTKTTIVVHSRYGVAASSASEKAPDRIARVIYLASFMTPNGKRVLDYANDRDSLLTGNIDVSRIGLWDWLRPAAYTEALYADCPTGDIALARALLVREPSRPALDQVKLSPRGYGRVPRAYIRLTQDRAVSLRLQDKLIVEAGADRIESLATSHSPYFSQPEALSRTILKLAGS